MIRLNVLNFLYIYKNPFLSEKNSQKPKIIGFFEKVEVIACFLHIKLTLKVNCRWYKENLVHFNISLRSIFVRHFLLYHKL